MCCYLLPVIVVVDQLILEKVDPRTLVLPFPQKIAVVVQGNLTGCINPWLVSFMSSTFVDLGQMVGVAAENICRAQDVRRVVVEAEMVVEDRKVGMVELQQVLQSTVSLVGGCFDVVRGGRGNIDAAARGGSPEAKLGHSC